MEEIDLKAVQITKEAVLRLIAEASRTAKKKEPDLLLADEVAKKLRLSKWRFYHVYKELGLVPVRRLGRKLLFPRVQVERLLGQEPARPGRKARSSFSRPLSRDAAHFPGTFQAPSA
ncbi:MAG: hypothetical protein SF051_06140 [Elusimicrobiota bacterium]|nr:hypothetical protein [Elusimicrobiota bacterium]